MAPEVSRVITGKRATKKIAEKITKTIGLEPCELWPEKFNKKAAYLLVR
jgi:lambda repressor-like predicted transcriptional regulator